MLKIFFLDVGQGDSIIIQWQKDGITKTGVVDCKQEANSVPTIEKLKKLSVTTIEFIILSHPHADHYSGMLKLLQFCKEKDVDIKYFLHTCAQVPDFLKSVEASQENRRKLRKLFEFVRTEQSSMDFTEAWIDAGMPNAIIPLNADLKLTFLSPTAKEYEDYLGNALPHIISEEHAGANPNANFLSTILKISHNSNGWYVLFTSDAEARSFKRLNKNKTAFLNNEVLLIGQSPHHGAKRNFHTNFWRLKNIRKKESTIIISVGNNNYGHPSPLVIEKYRKQGYKVVSTNSSSFIRSARKITQSEMTLNIFSSISPSTNSSNDKMVQIDDLGALKIS